MIHKEGLFSFFATLCKIKWMSFIIVNDLIMISGMSRSSLDPGPNILCVMGEMLAQGFLGN